MNKRYFITILLIFSLHSVLPAQQETYERAFSVAFENDMFNKMDWYYTNGIQFLLYHEKLLKSPLDRILIPVKAWKEDLSWHGLALRQELYTPRDLEDDTIRAGDHPYAATLTIAQLKVLNRPGSRFRFAGGLRVGVLGPAALGFNAQDIIHRITPSKPPKGWDYQVRNDVIINYDLTLAKEILRDDLTILGVKGTGRLGTLHTDLSGGIWFRMQTGHPYFHRLGPDPDRSSDLFFQVEGMGRLVGYDATLQGGMFNKTSPYIIPSESIKRLIGDIRLSFVFEIYGHRLSLYQHLTSSRFTESQWHGWMGINYSYWW